MNWFWPRTSREDATLLVRAARLLHWSFVGLAILFATVSMVVAISQGHTDSVFYVTVVLIWTGFALLGRGLRYLLAKE